MRNGVTCNRLLLRAERIHGRRERAGDVLDTLDIAGGDGRADVILQAGQCCEHPVGGVFSGAGQPDQYRAAVLRVALTADEISALKPVNDVGERGGLVTERAMKRSDRYRLMLGEARAARALRPD